METSGTLAPTEELDGDVRYAGPYLEELFEDVKYIVRTWRNFSKTPVTMDPTLTKFLKTSGALASTLRNLWKICTLVSTLGNWKKTRGALAPT